MQDLHDAARLRPEPVGCGGGELGRLTGDEEVFFLAQEKPQGARQHVDPGVALVTHERGFAGPQHLLEHLHLARMLGEGDDHAPGSPGTRFEVNARVTR